MKGRRSYLSKVYSGSARGTEPHTHSGAPRAPGRSPIDKETWKSSHPRKFGNHVTVHRASERPSVRTTGLPMENSSINRYGNPINSRFYLEGNHMATRTFRKKRQAQSPFFFCVIFYVYTNVDNRERARAGYWNKGDEFRRKKNMEIESGGEKMRNASSQQGANERQWKIKTNMNTGNKTLGKHIRQFLRKNNV